MKNKNIFLFIILWYCTSCSKEPINPVSIASINLTQISSITNLDLNDIAFVNSNIGYAVGDSGIIIKTTDSGGSWYKLTSGVENSLYSIYIVDSTNIFLSGSEIIMHSSNNGSTWDSISIINSLGFVFDDIKLNGNIGIAVGSYVWFDVSGPVVYKSTDYGASWGQIQIPKNTQILSSALLLDNNTYLISSQIPGGVGDSSRLWKTTNGGASFNIAHSSNYGLNSLSSYDNTNIFACGTFGKFYNSTNQGDSWTAHTINDSLQLTSIYAVNNSLIFTCGYNGYTRTNTAIYMSNNGGTSWSSINNSFNFQLKSLAPANSNKIFFVGNRGTILKLEISNE